MRRRRDAETLVAVVIAIIVLGTVVAVVLPASDASVRRPTRRACLTHPGECATSNVIVPGDTITSTEPEDPDGAAARNAGSSWARGRDVYLREGCFYCHTQQVRPVMADAGMGPVGNAGDYVFQDPPPLGSRRVGPDLHNVGARQPFTSCDAVKGYLRDPSSVYDWSQMPSYAHLSERDMDDLATYLTQLRPAGAPGPTTCEPAPVTDTITPTATP